MSFEVLAEVRRANRRARENPDRPLVDGERPTPQPEAPTDTLAGTPGMRRRFDTAR